MFTISAALGVFFDKLATISLAGLSAAGHSIQDWKGAESRCAPLQQLCNSGMFAEDSLLEDRPLQRNWGLNIHGVGGLHKVFCW